MQAKDPKQRFRRNQEPPGAAHDAFIGEVADQAARDAVTLRERVLAMPDPEPLQMFDHVYAGGSPVLDQQRSTHARYLAAFERGQN
jgi:pyruvate dehydrogenase E1 component alpha subunit